MPEATLPPPRERPLSQEEQDIARRQQELTAEHDRIARFLQETEAMGYGNPVRTRERDKLAGIRQQLADLDLAGRTARERGFLEYERENARNFNDLQRRRLDEATGFARRQIGEQEQLRQGQLESQLAAMNLSGSPIAIRAAARERELSQRALSETVSQLLSGELQRSFVAEQQAIDRLFQNGQGELAFERQWQMMERQLQAAMEIAELESDSSLWGDIFGAAGQVVGAVVGSPQVLDLVTGGR
jgi:hypothetical protein